MDEHDPVDARDIARSTVRAVIQRTERLERVLRTGGAPEELQRRTARALGKLDHLSDLIDEWRP